MVPFLDLYNGQEQVLTVVLIMSGGKLENGFSSIIVLTKLVGRRQ